MLYMMRFELPNYFNFIIFSYFNIHTIVLHYSTLLSWRFMVIDYPVSLMCYHKPKFAAKYFFTRLLNSEFYTNKSQFPENSIR